jgi:hypothetical protein
MSTSIFDRMAENCKESGGSKHLFSRLKKSFNFYHILYDKYVFRKKEQIWAETITTN